MKAEKMIFPRNLGIIKIVGICMFGWFYISARFYGMANEQNTMEEKRT